MFLNLTDLAESVLSAVHPVSSVSTATLEVVDFHDTHLYDLLCEL